MSATKGKAFNPFLAYANASMDEDDMHALWEAVYDSGGIVEDSPGGRLKFLRERRGLSLRAVANQVSEDTHFTTIAKLETGKMKMTDEWARKLAEVLSVPYQAILAPMTDPLAARAVPVYNIDDLTWDGSKLAFGAPETTTVVTVGGLKTYALAVMLSVDTPEGPGIVVIDPDETQIRSEKLYLIAAHGNSKPMLALFEPDPARFVAWIKHEDDRVSNIEIGQTPFAVLGRVVLVSYIP